jgi:hypothetical protein
MQEEGQERRSIKARVHVRHGKGVGKGGAHRRPPPIDAHPCVPLLCSFTRVPSLVFAYPVPHLKGRSSSGALSRRRSSAATPP